jgi:NAD-dependent SIR2 family protein deacetylase
MTPTTLTREELVIGIRTKQFNKIVFLVGAGISVAAGIPDFRTPKIGLYAQVKALGLPVPEDIFSLEYFLDNPLPFYEIAKKFLLYNNEDEEASASTGKPAENMTSGIPLNNSGDVMSTNTQKQPIVPVNAHHFMKRIEMEKQLLMIYTQNIDSLELEVGINEKKVVQAHGNMRKAHCVSCKKEYSMKEFTDSCQNGHLFYCAICHKLPTAVASDLVSDAFLKGKVDREELLLKIESRNEELVFIAENSFNEHDEDDYLTTSESNIISLPDLSCEETVVTVDTLPSIDSPSFSLPSPVCSRFLHHRSHSLCSVLPQKKKVYHSDEGGIIKPDIIFFGEKISKSFNKRFAKINEADLVIVMGTSLKVHPFSSLIGQIPSTTPLVIINKELPKLSTTAKGVGKGGRCSEDKENLLFLEGDIEENILGLAKDIGWNLQEGGRSTSSGKSRTTKRKVFSNDNEQQKVMIKRPRKTDSVVKL